MKVQILTFSGRKADKDASIWALKMHEHGFKVSHSLAIDQQNGKHITMMAVQV